MHRKYTLLHFSNKPRPSILYSWGETDTEEAEKSGRKKRKKAGGFRLKAWVWMTGLWPSSWSRPRCTSQTAGWGRRRAWSLGTAAVYRWVIGELFKAVHGTRSVCLVSGTWSWLASYVTFFFFSPVPHPPHPDWAVRKGGLAMFSLQTQCMFKACCCRLVPVYWSRSRCCKAAWGMLLEFGTYWKGE